MNENTPSIHNEKDTNPDAITGEPGSHPVGTGVGAASAGMTGAMIGTAVGGPVGGVIGAAVGSIIGGYAGKGVAELVDPTTEDAYWRDNHSAQSYADGDYNEYEHGYKTGYQGYATHGVAGRSFDEAESDLRKNYDATGAPVAWDKAKHASRAAWQRVENKAREVKNDVKNAVD